MALLGTLVANNMQAALLGTLAANDVLPSTLFTNNAQTTLLDLLAASNMQVTLLDTSAANNTGDPAYTLVANNTHVAMPSETGQPTMHGTLIAQSSHAPLALVASQTQTIKPKATQHGHQAIPPTRAADLTMITCLPLPI